MTRCGRPNRWPTGAGRTRFARRSRLGGDELTAILSLAASSDVITFSGGFPAPETFPVEVIRELTGELLSHDAALGLQYSPTVGLPAARLAVSAMIGAGQGVGVGADDVLITSGGIEAMQLLARTLIDPGDRVLVEAPTYLGAIMAFAGFEADVEGIAVDEDGIRLDELQRALAHGPRPSCSTSSPTTRTRAG